MTREQFLLQAESLKPGLTGHKFCDALDEDIKKCIELSKQGKMYSLQEFEYKNMAYIKYIEDSIVDSEECAAGAWQDIDDYDNMNKVLKNADADDAQYISSMAPVEVLYSAITRLRIDMLDVYALRLAADIMLKRVHYTIFNTHDIGSTVQNPAALPLLEEPVVVEQSTMEEVLDSPEIQEVIKSASDEVSAAYDMVMSHIGDITKENVDGLISTIGKDIVDKIRNGEQTAESLWKDLVGKIVNREEISGGVISEKAWDCIMQKISESGIARKVIDMIKAIVKAADESLQRQNDLASTNNTAAASVNHTVLNGQRLSPRDIAERLNRDKAMKGMPIHQPPVQNPAPIPQQVAPNPFVGPAIQQQAEQNRLMAEKAALQKMILFAPDTTLVPQDVHDLYHVMMSQKLQSGLDEHQIIRNMNIPYLWEIKHHKEFDTNKYSIAFAGESYHKDIRIIVLVNIPGKSVDIISRPLMDVMKPRTV